jgi:tRNA(His) guanylyltransferase
MTSDALAARMKSYEVRETERAVLPGLPLVVRVDGRSFSKFTAGMRQPYDQELADLMQATAQYLVQKTDAVIGYTQSDEISLLLEPPQGDVHRRQDMLFGGRIQKLVSVTASMATAFFVTRAVGLWPDRCARELPIFDSRVFAVPNRIEAINALIWREQDATKNAITMAARAFYTHKDLHKKSGAEKQDMLFQKGVNFNDYPARFKRGVYLQRRDVLRELSPIERARIPTAHQPKGPLRRSQVVVLDLPPFARVSNREAVVFDKADASPMTAPPAPPKRRRGG